MVFIGLFFGFIFGATAMYYGLKWGVVKAVALRVELAIIQAEAAIPDDTANRAAAVTDSALKTVISALHLDPATDAKTIAKVADTIVNRD